MKLKIIFRLSFNFSIFEFSTRNILCEPPISRVKFKDFVVEIIQLLNIDIDRLFFLVNVDYFLQVVIQRKNWNSLITIKLNHVQYGLFHGEREI